MKHIEKKTVLRDLMILASPLVFLALYALVTQGIPLTQIDLLNNSWNDELFYNRQITAILRGGYPHGYFGYDGSQAGIGSFGGWGPLILYLYAVPGLLLQGLGVNMLLGCNVLFITLAWFVFVRTAKLGWAAQLLFAAGMALCGMPVRYVLSGMTETISYALMLAIIGLSVSLLRRYRASAMGWLLALCVLFTLLRPYGIALWGFPLACAWKQKQRRALWLGAASAPVTVAASLVLNSSLFSADYFVNPINWSFLDELMAGHLYEAVRSLWYIFRDACTYLADLFAGPMTLESASWLAAALSAAALLVQLAARLRQKRPVVLELCLLAAILLVGAALVFLGYINQGYRHILFLTVGIWAVLSLEPSRHTGAALAVLAVCGLVLEGFPASSPLPVRDEGIRVRYERDRAALAEVIEPSDEIPGWGNTVAFSLATDYRLLYAMPDTMGQQLYLDPGKSLQTGEIKARYVLFPSADTATKELFDGTWEKLWETEDFVLFENLDF